MELSQLKYYVTIAETLSFTKAADLLRVSQPALSYQMRRLEIELGTKLFDREHRKIALTPDGRLFLPLAQSVLLRADEAVAGQLDGCHFVVSAMVRFPAAMLADSSSSQGEIRSASHWVSSARVSIRPTVENRASVPRPRVPSAPSTSWRARVTFAAYATAIRASGPTSITAPPYRGALP